MVNREHHVATFNDTRRLRVCPATAGGARGGHQHRLNEKQDEPGGEQEAVKVQQKWQRQNGVDPATQD
jgi:hypothetical protein